jgi:membrane protein
VVRFTRRIAWRAVVRFFDHNGPDRAAAVAYYLLLSLLPLLVFLISLGSIVSRSSEAAYSRALFLLQGVLAHTDQATLDALRQFAERAGHLQAVSSLIILAWTSKRVFASLLSALEDVFGHPGRGILKGNLVTLALVLVTGVGLLLTMVLEAVLATAEGVVRRFAPPEAATMFGGLAALLARTFLPILITMTFLYIVYRIAAPARFTSRHALGGALLATLLWEGAKAAFAWYLRNLARYAGLYGALEGVIVLAIWVELSVSIVLYGAEVVALMGPNGTIDSRAEPGVGSAAS